MNETDLDALPPDDPIDLLERDLFTLTDNDRSVVSLAEIFARLGRGEPTELAYLMPHQRHAMHAFVVQLMAMVVSRSGDRHLDREASEWRDGLRKLAGSAEAFQLVVRDWSKPAFLQPPVPEGNLGKFKPLETPDALDLLVLAKNHDVKMARIRRPRVEHWIFALLSLQTQQGYSGRDNHGVTRMNGGFGNRPGFGMTPSLVWTAHVRRDVAAALEVRDAPVTYRDEGLACVWTEPWDGTTSIALTELDRLFVEICRRVRITRDERGLVVAMTSTKVPRLEGKSFLGNVGDLWTPVDRERGTALTLPGTGLPYARLSQILFEEDWIRPAALQVRSEDGEEPLAIARALVRGQGKTEGLHERVIRVPKKARPRIATAEGRASLGKLAKDRVELARALRLKVLKPALCAYLQGGADDLRFDDDRADSHLDAVDDAIDAEFFPRLFEDIELEADAAQKSFETWLLALGRAALERAIESLPTAAARRERAIASAEARFFGGARKNLPNADRSRNADRTDLPSTDPAAERSTQEISDDR